MDVVENDVDYHFHGLKLVQPVIDPSSMKRVHRAQLPGNDSERVIEVLGKIAAIAKSRQESRAELEEVREQLRRSEFARERAESMATARGAALMKCQEALTDAEEQQVQLSGLLRSALDQLGVGTVEKGERTPVTHGMTPYSRHSQHGVSFRYTNITPPSGIRSVYSQKSRRTPLTGFTVYSNPVSEEIHGDPDDFETPARGNNTYYSSEEDERDKEDEQDEQDKHGDAVAIEVSQSRSTAIGEATAQKLAREVLPHLGSQEIQYLVEYNRKERDMMLRERVAREQQYHQGRPHQQQGHHRPKTKTKTSTFVVGGPLGAPSSDDEDGFRIPAGVESYDGIPSVERRRNAAARIVAKLNERLPPELHIQSLTGLEA